VSSYHDCPYHHRITNQEGNIMTTATLTRRKPTADDLKVGLVLHGDLFSTSFARVELVGKYGTRSWRCRATTHNGDKRNPFIYNSTLLDGRYYMDVPEPTLDDRIAELERELAAVKQAKAADDAPKIGGRTDTYLNGAMLRIRVQYRVNGPFYTFLAVKLAMGTWSPTGNQFGGRAVSWKAMADYFNRQAATSVLVDELYVA
jgi:hypothetical protein